jgi:hypothetical protein
MRTSQEGRAGRLVADIAIELARLEMLVRRYARHPDIRAVLRRLDELRAAARASGLSEPTSEKC